MEFKTLTFGSLDRYVSGREIWDALNSPEWVTRMIVASELRHSAMDGVILLLEKDYREFLQHFRHRQLVGAMIVQVMASRGWSREPKTVRVRFGNLFTMAARFSKALI